MKTIGIIIGTDDEPISKKYYQKHKKKFECLNELINLDYIPFDYALYAEAKVFEKKYNVTVIPLIGDDLTLKECNKCDSIFCLYDGTWRFINGGNDSLDHYINIIKKTKAKVYPSPQMQEFILYKKRYMQ